MRKFIGYITGCAALISVSAAIVVTIHFLATSPNAPSQIGSSMLAGLGTALGAFLGGAMVLRFKAARSFLRKLFIEKED